MPLTINFSWQFTNIYRMPVYKKRLNLNLEKTELVGNFKTSIKIRLIPCLFKNIPNFAPLKVLKQCMQ